MVIEAVQNWKTLTDCFFVIKHEVKHSLTPENENNSLINGICLLQPILLYAFSKLWLHKPESQITQSSPGSGCSKGV